MIKEEVAKQYIKEYNSNGYNKTRAYLKLHPNSSSNSARASVIPFHTKVLAHPSVKEFQEMLKTAIPEQVIVTKVNEELNDKHQRKDGINHWLAITGYTEPSKSQVDTTITTKAEQSILDKYIASNRLGKDSD